MNFFKKYLIPLLILVVSIVFVLALMKTKPKTSQKIAQELEWVVNAEIAKPATHSPTIKLYGQLISSAEIELSVNTESTVVQRHVEIGNNVEKGQVLITLDSFIQQQLLEQRQAEVEEIHAQIKDEHSKHESNLTLLKREKNLLTLAEASVERAKTLEKREMASSSQLDEARMSAIAQEIAISQRQQLVDSHTIRIDQLNARLKQAKTRLALAQNELDDTIIRSPVYGLVQQIKIDDGELVRKGSSLITLLDKDKLEIRALVPEKYLPAMQQSLSGAIQSTTAVIIHQQQAYNLILARMANFVEKGLAGSYAYFQLDSSLSPLIVGQTYELQLLLPGIENSILLPHEALYGTNQIFIIENSRLVSRTINWIGEAMDQSGNNKILITSEEIKDNDRVLTSKFANAIDGLKVKVSE